MVFVLSAGPVTALTLSSAGAETWLGLMADSMK